MTPFFSFVFPCFVFSSEAKEAIYILTLYFYQQLKKQVQDIPGGGAMVDLCKEILWWSKGLGCKESYFAGIVYLSS